TYPGFTLGGIIDYHIGGKRSYLREHLDLRLIPSIVLTTRRINYTTVTDQSVEKEIESALLELPLLLKFKSVRFTNMRFYVIGGVKYSYDLASDVNSARDPFNPKVAIQAHNYSYEMGTGLDIYFEYFKFSPEIKISRGINNVLVQDNSRFTRIFSGFRSNFLYLSFCFEG
ncbi:MAG: outer membrane beta-barrel protein, partial [Bacteroidota bacterium]|nr:outer membrane beta-barrel protein [Bacteroidota bacterium]